MDHHRRYSEARLPDMILFFGGASVEQLRAGTGHACRCAPETQSGRPGERARRRRNGFRPNQSIRKNWSFGENKWVSDGRVRTRALGPRQSISLPNGVIALFCSVLTISRGVLRVGAHANSLLAKTRGANMSQLKTNALAGVGGGGGVGRWMGVPFARCHALRALTSI